MRPICCSPHWVLSPREPTTCSVSETVPQAWCPFRRGRVIGSTPPTQILALMPPPTSTRRASTPSTSLPPKRLATRPPAAFPAPAPPPPTDKWPSTPTTPTPPPATPWCCPPPCRSMPRCPPAVPAGSPRCCSSKTARVPQPPSRWLLPGSPSKSPTAAPASCQWPSPPRWSPACPPLAPMSWAMPPSRCNWAMAVPSPR